MGTLYYLVNADQKSVLALNNCRFYTDADPKLGSLVAAEEWVRRTCCPGSEWERVLTVHWLQENGPATFVSEDFYAAYEYPWAVEDVYFARIRDDWTANRVLGLSELEIEEGWKEYRPDGIIIPAGTASEIDPHRINHFRVLRGIDRDPTEIERVAYNLSKRKKVSFNVAMAHIVWAWTKARRKQGACGKYNPETGKIEDYLAKKQ